MKPTKFGITNWILVAVSVAAIGLAVASVFRSDDFYLYGTRGWIILNSRFEYFVVEFANWPSARPEFIHTVSHPDIDWRHLKVLEESGFFARDETRTYFNFLHFRVASYTVAAHFGVWLQIPYWFICLAALLRPLIFVRRIRRTKRLRQMCTTCGYDLRASKERCPECGAAIHNPERQEKGT